MKTYTAQQLSELLQQEAPDMNLRTVRYYTQIGLLPPLDLFGNKRVYTDKHLHYLRAIVTLSKTGETLAAIQDKLARLTIEQIEKIGDKLALYRSEHVLENETLQVSKDVLLTISPRVSDELKERMIHTLTQMLKGEQRP